MPPLNRHPTAPRTFKNSSATFHGTPDTLKAMRSLTLEGQVSPEIRNHAENIIRQVQPKDYLSELAAIYYDTCRTIRYTRDPAEAEYLQHPELLLQNKSGDCDDIALFINTLLKSLASSIGNDTYFTVVAFDKNDDWSHVFLTVIDERSGMRVVLDPVAGHRTSDMIRQAKKFKHFGG